MHYQLILQACLISLYRQQPLYETVGEGGNCMAVFLEGEGVVVGVGGGRKATSEIFPNG
jgi:hypothetical protein